MAKKAIHHFNRGLMVGFEVIGFCAILACLAWLALLWRLSQGPLDVGFLTGKLERALSAQHHSFSFEVAETRLVWGGRLEPLELRMERVSVLRADKTPVAMVDKLDVQLSRRNLVFGRIVPKAIRIHGPALRVIRWEDGHFSLNLAQAAPQEGGAETAAAPPPSPDPVRELLARMLERRLPLLGGLERVEITQAQVYYDDRGLGAGWSSRAASIVFERTMKGMVAQAGLDLDLAGGEAALLRANATYDWVSRRTVLLLAFADLNPARLARHSEKLSVAAQADMPLGGSVALALDRDFRPQKARILLAGGAGTFNLPGLYETPVPVHAFTLDGEINLVTREGGIERCSIDLGGPVAQVRAQVRPGAQDGESRITAQAALAAMPLDALDAYWPPALAADAREWVTQHLSAGIAHTATLDAALVFTPGAEEKVALEDLGGEIGFSGITVDYFPPLRPVTGVEGKAVYDARSFTLALAGGALGDMAVGKSDIRITGLDHGEDGPPAEIDITASLSGPLGTALAVLDSKPLEYPRSLGIAAGDAGGHADVDVSFRFPLHRDLALGDVAVKADARLRGVRLAGIVKGYDLTGGPMTLSVDNAALEVKGEGRLGGMPVAFDWARDFRAATSRVDARATLDAAAMRDFGVPAALEAGGALPATITYATHKDGKATLTLKGDLKDAFFSLPAAGYRKPAGVEGSLDFVMDLQDGVPAHVSGLSVQAPGLVLRGDVDFAQGRFRKAAFGQVAFGETDISLTAESAGPGGYVLHARGRQLDASPFLEDADAAAPRPPRDAPAEEKPPFSLTLDVERMLTGNKRQVDKVKAFLHRDAWGRIHQLEMDGIAGGKAIYLRYMPVPDGHTLRFEADNAGAALAALGFTRSVKGGKLAISAGPAPKSGPRDLQGTALLTDFTLVRAPALARLLNAMSVPGLFDLLNGEGIAFRKARADFWWTDRGPPADPRQVRLLRIKDGQTSGASLGLMFEGKIDNWSHTYDLQGTIVPVSDLSKLLNNIPIIGNVLTAGGEGVFAATYTIKGPKSDPTVTVNPLAALAPGILRKMFFEN